MNLIKKPKKMKKILFVLFVVAFTSCATQRHAPKVSREQTVRSQRTYCAKHNNDRKYHRHLHKLVTID